MVNFDIYLYIYIYIYIYFVAVKNMKIYKLPSINFYSVVI